MGPNTFVSVVGVAHNGDIEFSQNNYIVGYAEGLEKKREIVYQHPTNIGQVK